MRKLVLPGTDLTVSSLCLGTLSLGSTLDLRASFKLLDAFVDQGGNFLDTAKIYADWLPGEKSLSEKTIGRWLRERKSHGPVVVGTKGAHPDLEAMNVPRLSSQEIRSDVEASLLHLGVDRIDLYWLHRDDTRRPVEEILGTMGGLVRAGKIRYFGCSNWTLERIRASQVYAKKTACPGFVANQPMWSLAKVNPGGNSDPTLVVMDEAMQRYHRENGFAAIPYSSQANGWFQKMAAGISTQGLSKYSNQANEGRSQRVQKLAEQSGSSITQVVLGYLLSQPFATCPIIGCHSLAQLQDSLKASEVVLTPEQVKYLEAGE